MPLNHRNREVVPGSDLWLFNDRLGLTELQRIRKSGPWMLESPFTLNAPPDRSVQSSQTLQAHILCGTSLAINRFDLTATDSHTTLPAMHISRIVRSFGFAIACFTLSQVTFAQTTPGALETKPADPFFAKLNPIKAPTPAALLLQPGDRIMICGDSITEQRMYSRIIETYLTVCVPELQLAVRQLGWSGERAPGFLVRMTNDCLRFAPTIATLCYGMNDHEYRAFEPEIGQRYRDSITAIVQTFKNHGVRVVLGSPGCVGQKVPWAKASSEEMNANLCNLRNICIEVAVKENTAFADVFWPMITAGFNAKQRFGEDYMIAGKDGVHPDWAGHLVMAYAFLKAMGLDGNIGTVKVDLSHERVSITPGHELHGMSKGEITITSHKYLFCAAGDINRDNSIRSAMALVPFNPELNRFMLIVTNAPARSYKIAWGDTVRTYTSQQLAKGVNLADDFIINPFSKQFEKVDQAVAAKQSYETRQVKMLFHGDEGRIDMNATIALTEKVREKYVEKIEDAFVPITHTIRIVPEQ